MDFPAVDQVLQIGIARWNRSGPKPRPRWPCITGRWTPSCARRSSRGCVTGPCAAWSRRPAWTW
ncbi:hypothetical protein CTI14_61680, partial [Methylobacterium radiotolerans]